MFAAITGLQVRCPNSSFNIREASQSMAIFAVFRRWLNIRKATLHEGSPVIVGEVQGSVLSLSNTESMTHNETPPTYVYDVLIHGEL